MKGAIKLASFFLWPFHLHSMELSLYGLNVNRSVMPYFQYILLFLPCLCMATTCQFDFFVCCHVCYSRGYCPYHLLPIMSSCRIFSYPNCTSFSFLCLLFLVLFLSLSFSLSCLDSLCSLPSGCEYVCADWSIFSILCFFFFLSSRIAAVGLLYFISNFV